MILAEQISGIAIRPQLPEPTIIEHEPIEQNAIRPIEPQREPEPMLEPIAPSVAFDPKPAKPVKNTKTAACAPPARSSRTRCTGAASSSSLSVFLN